MEQFRVPQFIEQEMKVAGPLTFKQALFVGGAFIGCVMLYMILYEKSFFLFLLTVILVAGSGIALAFVKIHGRSLPVVLANLLMFSASSKEYLWKKKMMAPKTVTIREKKPEDKKEKGPSLQVSEKSQLQNLSTKLETGTH